MSAIWVEIIRVRGSAPRDAGTAMEVRSDAIRGTIGGGALELMAISIARDMMATGSADMRRTFPLGPALGQCCGGSVTLAFGRERRVTDADAQPIDGGLEPATAWDNGLGGSPVWPSSQGAAGSSAVPRSGPGSRFAHGQTRHSARSLWLWGAGHVGRAFVASAPARYFDITWLDTASDRFPREVSPNVTAVPAADLPRIASRADRSAEHLIFTYSHDLDLALCAALLRRNVAGIGLIGSETKRARFFRRLRAIGLDPSPITCPIGDKSLGKAPMDIARGTIAALLRPDQRTGAA